MDADVKAEKLREDERILQAIDKCISSRDDHYERNKAILKEMLDDVFTTMKGRNPFFRQHFQDFFFVENYYKGPKVGKQEEFRVNIVIKIPLNFAHIQVKVRKDSSPCTLCFNKQGFPEMNVSLVPVLELGYKSPHPTMKDLNTYAVPVILENVADENFHWKMAFYNHEADLLTRHSYLEPVIRQFEKLRHSGVERYLVLSYQDSVHALRDKH